MQQVTVPSVSFAGGSRSWLHLWQDSCKRHSGLKVGSAFLTGDELLFWIEQGRGTDWLILDEMLGDMGALEFLHRLEDLPGKKPRIVLITGSRTVEAAAYARQMHAVIIFRKPCREDAVLQYVEWLARESAQAGKSPQEQLLDSWEIKSTSRVYRYLMELMQIFKENPDQLDYKAAIMTAADRQNVDVKTIESSITRMLRAKQKAKQGERACLPCEEGLTCKSFVMAAGALLLKTEKDG